MISVITKASLHQIKHALRVSACRRLSSTYRFPSLRNSCAEHFTMVRYRNPSTSTKATLTTRDQNQNMNQTQHGNLHAGTRPQAPPPSRDKRFGAALKAMAQAWYNLVCAKETGKAEVVKLCAVEVFGVTAFELAMEDVLLGGELGVDWWYC